jgi:uncharacterized Zn finger protein
MHMSWGGDEWYHHRYRRTTPRKVRDGMRARSRQGEIGKTWWSHRWLETLLSYGWSNRLDRGRRYARMGQVVSLKLSRGRVESMVQGSRPKPYRVTIEVKSLPKEKWKGIAASMASRAVFASKLLAGEMPMNVEEAFSSSSVTLFPTKREIRTDCSCPDDANPCKHITAAYYILAEEFDRDPFVMFLLRGETKEELMDALREGRRTANMRNEVRAPKAAVRGGPNDADVPPLEDCVAVFWSELKPLGHVGVSQNRPYVDAAVIKRLGEPPFWREPEDFTELMKGIYQEVTSKALQLAFS